MTRTILQALLVSTFTLGELASSADAKTSPRPEVRALWVDGFHAGIRSPQEVAELVENAKRLHFNTLIVQVRRRGDSLYTGGLEPPLDDPNYDPTFDGLKAVLDAGHQAGLKVHAWINAMPIWRDEPAPKDPRHIFNRHGLGLRGNDAWLTRSREGAEKFSVGYFLDPGHPAVQDHLVKVYLDIVRRYAVDGIHFDYIRYPETEARLPRGSNVGYNEVSLSRFHRATGRTDLPAPDDPAWTDWRREQVTQLVRRVSIEARALNPKIQVSAATIAWGAPPRSLADFENVAPMQRIFQNWQSWLVEGVLDMAVPMNYARDHDPTVRGWFNGWIEWEKRHKADRSLVVGIGAYLNTKQGVLAQVDRVRAPIGKRHADGVSFFSYFRPAAPPPGVSAEASLNSPAPPPADRLDFLGQGFEGAVPAFTEPAPVPSMPWIDAPTQGFLTGAAVSPEGKALDGAVVRMKRSGWFQKTHRVKTDGNGWFGLARLKPGRYAVRIDTPGRANKVETVTVEVRAGAVSRLDRPLVGQPSF